MPDLSSLTFISRINTVCVDLKDVYSGPTVPTAEWAVFVKEDLKVKAEELALIQLHTITGMLMIELKEELVYQRILSRLQEGVVWTKYKAKVFGWSVHEALSTVSVVNLSRAVDPGLILNKLGEFGKIINSRVGTSRVFPGGAGRFPHYSDEDKLHHPLLP